MPWKARSCTYLTMIMTIHSQPYYAENYPTIDQGKMKYFAIITPITVEINYLPSYFQCNHSLTDVSQQITIPSGKLSK